MPQITCLFSSFRALTGVPKCGVAQRKVPAHMNPRNRLAGFGSALVLLFGVLAACSPPPTYDVVLRGGTIYDGSSSAGYVGDVAIDGDTVVALGDIGKAKGRQEVDDRA
jgi:hypothetical protein